METFFNNLKMLKEPISDYLTLIKKMNKVFSDGIIQNSSFGDLVRGKVDVSEDHKIKDSCSDLESFISYISLYGTFNSFANSGDLNNFRGRTKNDFKEAFRILNEIYFVSNTFYNQSPANINQEIALSRELESIIKDSIETKE
jgi:hypothetical protein